jgi:hypothetical protein
MSKPRTIRRKVFNGVTYSWTIGNNKDGDYRVLSVGNPSNKMPMSFAPFEIMDMAMNKSAVFDSEDELIQHIETMRPLSDYIGATS